jgi:ABC-type glycerol-3-phosphate transport system permease component
MLARVQHRKRARTLNQGHGGTRRFRELGGCESHRRLGIARGARFGLLVVIALVVNVPIITMVLNSLQTNDDLMVATSVLPQHPTLTNYATRLGQTDFPAYFKNSVIVGGISTAVSIIIAALAGYALARYQGRWLSAYGTFILLLQMFPIILALIPLFLIFKSLSLNGTYWSAVLIYISAQLPFATWLYRGFFTAIPRELEEAAWIDGCSRFQGFARIVLPISTPGVAAVAIFSFLLVWNDFLIANIFLNQQNLMTIPVGIQMYIQQYSSAWASLMTAATVAMVPVLLFLVFVQKYMVQGMTAGAVRG